MSCSTALKFIVCKFVGCITKLHIRPGGEILGRNLQRVNFLLNWILKSSRIFDSGVTRWVFIWYPSWSPRKKSRRARKSSDHTVSDSTHMIALTQVAKSHEQGIKHLQSPTLTHSRSHWKIFRRYATILLLEQALSSSQNYSHSDNKSLMGRLTGHVLWT